MKYEYGSNITADSTPDSDDWGWDKYWSATDWQIWFSRLKKKYGLKKAREKWSSAWEKETDDMWSGAHKYKLYPSFSKFMKDNGLEGSDAISDFAVGVQNVISGTGKTASNLSEGLTKGSQTLKIVLPIVVLVALVGAGYYGYKTFINK